MADTVTWMEEEFPVSTSTTVTIETPVIPIPTQQHQHQQQPLTNDSRPPFRNRMMLCGLAIAFNWGTSLRIANIFASSAINAPPLDAVTGTCRIAYNFTRDERLRYSKCVESQLNQCNSKLDRSIEQEDMRVRLVAKQNEDVVQRMEEVATSCSKSYSSLRLALQGWTANGGKIPTRVDADDGICTAEDQELFNQTLMGTQNIIALQTDAMDITNAYGDESTLTVVRLAEYVAERAEYDANYVDQKTQRIQNTMFSVVDSVDVTPVSLDDLLDELDMSAVNVIACLSLDLDARMSDGSKCDPNVAAMVNSFRNNAIWKVGVLKQALYDYRDRMEEYKENVQRAYEVAKRFYNGVNNSVTRWIIDTFFAGDWFRVSLFDMTPVDVTFPDVDQVIGSIGSFQSIDVMWSKVVPDVNSFHVNLGSTSESIKARFTAFIRGMQEAYSASVRLVPSMVPDDYDPPMYVGTSDLISNPDEEVTLFRDKSDLVLFVQCTISIGHVLRY
jgi:hypothetical protein